MSKANRRDNGKLPSPTPPKKPWFYWATFAVRLLLYITGAGDLPS